MAWRSTRTMPTEAEHSPGVAARGGGDIAQKMAALMAKRAQAQAELDRLEASGETQLSRTDADARLLTKNGQTVAGYNVQIAVDDKHKLIVASEVVNDGNDTGQLYKMAKAAKEALGAETLQAVADVGYYNGATLKACEDDGIVAYVPQAKRTGRLQAQGRFSHEDFTYEAAANVYRCPAGSLLQPTKGRKNNTGGRIEIRYMSRKATCDACPLRGRCVTDKTPTRTVYRWEHEDVIERHRARMKDAGCTDAPPRRLGGASLRHAQMPRRLSPLPCARLQQGARRVEPDGALLQLQRVCSTSSASMALSPTWPSEWPKTPFYCFRAPQLPGASSKPF